ncbi:MAG: aminotransferase class I/II-fold pyridoxal phosphate-dependent enzyme, partial [Abditibacteriaceae bacterium]
AENNFVASPPAQKVDLIYLCFPNNPTGAVASKAQLQEWVDYANANDAIILYDAAYGDYISDGSIPRSIYQIVGARNCAIEFRSFSKSGGFTGIRCGLVVIPKELKGTTPDGEQVAIHPLWSRRSSTKFNGVSYPVQRAAEALYSPEGRQQVRGLVDHYMGNAKILRAAVSASGLKVWGGENAPYIWVQAPTGVSSWDAFDKILNEANVVVTPGAGFGSEGEGYFRISAFNSRENAEEVARRWAELKW